MTTGATFGSRERAALARAATAALEAAAESAARELDRHAAGFGLSNAKLEMLEVLRCCAGLRTCLYDLGDRLGVTRPNITKLVDGLERGGLVERIPHPADKRMVQAHLTVRGAALADWALPGREERIERLWAGLDDEELLTLIHLLEIAAAGARQQRLEAGTASA
ncbi:MAG: hypothetical protein QOK40_1960 [Miltoncostaeaceae bacterium]|jgi:DNA-binding MarR family transcriptional regulator|nr:hypothetical protein [Miltoncostaeaceae bacterium]